MELTCYDNHDGYNNDHDYCTTGSVDVGVRTNLPQPQSHDNIKTNKLNEAFSATKPVKVTVEDFDRCCRLCLTQNGNIIPLTGACLDLMLKELYNIQIHIDDGYPQNICRRCSIKVSSAHSFYKLVLNSRRELSDALMASKMLVTDETTQVVDNASRCEDAKAVEMHEICDDNETMHILSDTNRKANETMIEGCLKKDFFSNNLMVEMATLQKNLQDLYDGYTMTPCGQADVEVDATKAQTHSKTNLEDIDIEPTGQNKLINPNSLFITKCELFLCGKTYKTLDTLLRHKEMAHKENKSHLCSYCGKKFEWASSLFRHLRYHTRRGLNACCMCSKTFSTKSYLRIHQASHTDTRHKCKICSCEFTQKSSLYKHMRSQHAHDYEPVCVLCNTTFDSRELLATHLWEAHGEEVTYKCTLCEDVFRELEDYDLHLKFVHRKKKKILPARAILDNKKTPSPLAKGYNYENELNEFRKTSSLRDQYNTALHGSSI